MLAQFGVTEVFTGERIPELSLREVSYLLNLMGGIPVREEEKAGVTARQNILSCDLFLTTPPLTVEITVGKQEFPIIQLRLPSPGLSDSAGRN